MTVSSTKSKLSVNGRDTSCALIEEKKSIKRKMINPITDFMDSGL